MKLKANIINIKSTKKGTYPGDKSGESIIITQEGSAEKGIRLRIGSIDICIGAFNYGVAFPEKPGETKVYSTDSEGVEKASQYLDETGNHTFNNGTDYAVAFEDLKAEFDKLNNAWNTFAAAYVPGSPVSLGTPPTASTSGSNIDNAKVPSMRVP